MLLVVWTLDGTPVYALARELHQHVVEQEPLHALVAHLNLETLGSTLVLLCSLLGTSRAGRTTLAVPVTQTSSRVVEVVFARGSLCMVGVVLCGVPASQTDSVLDHPKLPLALLALSLLEPPCRPDSKPQQRVGNPLVGPSTRPAKTTPTNHPNTALGGTAVDTPGAPVKRERSGSLVADDAAEASEIIALEAVGDAFGGDANHELSVLAASSDPPPPPRRGRWCAVVQELVARRDDDRKDALRRQAFTGKEVLSEVRTAPKTALTMQATSEVSELHQTIRGLIDWWTGVAADCHRSIWLIVTSEGETPPASRKAINGPSATRRREDTICAYGYEPFPSLVLPTWTRSPLAPTDAPPTTPPNGAAEQPVCFPRASFWTRPETHVLTTVTESQRRYSVVMAASGKAAPSMRKLEAAVAYWNGLVDCATSWM